MYIGDWIGRSARSWGARTAVVELARGERFSYQALELRARRMARFLREKANVQKGDRVAILAMNGVEYYDLFFACCKLGAIFVPLNWRLHRTENAALLERIAPKLLAFGEEFRSDMQGLTPSLTHSCVRTHLGTQASLEGSLSHETIVTEGLAPFIEEPSVQEDDDCALLFTGGTTGLPKAARISLRMVAWNTLNTIVHELDRTDIVVAHTPMFHTGGLFAYTMPALVLGATVVVMKKWTPDAMLETIENEKVSLLFCVPTQWQMMLDAPRFAKTSFASVRFCTSGGAPLPVPVVRAYRDAKGVVFKQGFGMTEFGPGVFSMAPEYAETKAGAIGRPNYFVDARVVDDHNQPLPAGHEGELVLKGPVACSGYYGDETASKNAVDAEGWFHTGDIARVDDDGFYFIVDRKKDMFISGGENVYPLEIEKVLYEHDAVGRCAVIGVKDEKWGEVGRAIVVKKAGATIDEATLIEHCRGRLAKYKVPKSVVFVEELPTSAAGKILKRTLREQYG